MGEVEEEKQKALQCVAQLRNYLTDDVDLEVPIQDEDFLLQFVRGKKYDVELAHKTVRKYYTLQQKNPLVFKNFFPNQEIVKQILETNVYAVLKQRDLLGRPVVVSNIPYWDAAKFHLDPVMTAWLLIFQELLLTTLEAQVNGLVILCNAASFSMHHAKFYSLKRIKFILEIYQGSFPVRIKAFPVVNEPTVLDIIIAAARPFMSQKFKERFQLHGQNFEKLHELIPASSLPEQFGGSLTEDEAYDKDFIKTLFSRDSYYQDLLKYGYKE